MNRNELANKIRRIDGLTNDEKSALIELLRKQKKYGLVWEDKPEDVEERLREELPVLIEDTGKAIVSEDTDAPNHILIEGDNLEALTALAYTHEGQIDVIYIDPPYNTGNKDFVYNDQFVDKEDSYRHSKWLSFMSKRLRIAKRLLSDKGVIFISIDDNEQAQLKLLCDEVFGQENMIGLLPTVMNLKGNQDEFGFAGCHEYTIVYSKQIQLCNIGQLNETEEGLEDWLQDNIGYYKKGATLKRTGTDSPREKRPYGYFPILVSKQNKTVKPISNDEYKQIFNPIDKSFDDKYVESLITKYDELGYYVILPIVNNTKASWRWGFNTVCKGKDEIIVIEDNNSISLYKKQRPELGDLPTKKPKSILYKPQYSSGNGTAQLKSLNLEKSFSNPKPIDLIMDLCLLGSTKTSTVLDFFAGSGTTLHAAMQLNAEDGGHRKCILVTNNENNICEEVTYERNKRVIQGYTTPKGEEVPGLTGNTLRYYRTDFISRDRSPRNMRALVAASTDLLCIKNDIYKEAKLAGRNINPKIARYFAEGGRSMLVIYDERAISAIAETLETVEPGKEKIKVYVFSAGSYAYDDEFEEVADKVELCALPDAIYQAYQKVLPKRRPKFLPEAMEENERSNSPENGTLNFTDEEAEA